MNTIEINACDFNYKAGFDGFPFSDNPDWLLRRIECGDVKILDPNPHCTDYAIWEINTSNGKKEGQPGDQISCVDGRLDLIESGKGRFSTK